MARRVATPACLVITTLEFGRLSVGGEALVQPASPCSFVLALVS